LEQPSPQPRIVNAFADDLPQVRNSLTLDDDGNLLQVEGGHAGRANCRKKVNVDFGLAR
jgi:hypothetical protein